MEESLEDASLHGWALPWPLGCGRHGGAIGKLGLSSCFSSAGCKQALNI